MTRISAKIYQSIFTLFLLLLLNQATAQSLKDHVQKGDRYYQRKDYGNALISYREALALDPNNAQILFRTGVSCLHEELHADALNFLQKAHQLEKDVDPQIDYHLAMAFQENHGYAKAIVHYESFGKKYKNLAGMANQKIKQCVLADSLMKIKTNATVRVVDGLNTRFAEYSPLTTAAGDTMYFTSDRTDDDYAIKSKTHYGDVYLRRKESGQWSAPEKIGAPINVALNESAVGISPDGRTLLLYYEEGNGDLYSSTLSGNEWSKPEPLNRFINHPHFRESSAAISPDGKKLFFSSNRPGGKGGYDIYVSKLDSNGDWGRPSNLTSPVNTRGDEEFPFVHRDGTLYFSSNGHPTLGDHDIYRTSLVEGSWSQPEHLGHPINTRGFDGGFCMTDDGQTAYFSSRRGDHPDNSDLYEVRFSSAGAVDHSSDPVGIEDDTPETGNPSSIVTVLKGTVTDMNNATPLQATIRLVNNSNDSIISTLTTGPSGNFELVIAQPGNYGVLAEKTGYLFNSMNFNIAAFEEYQEIDANIVMTKADVGSKVILKNIFFDVNKSVLKPESLSELKTIRDILLKNPRWRIQVNGHTDNVGNAETNLALSLARAKAVVEYLINEGIAEDRLEAKGYGAERPLVSNDDEDDGRQINRRTEIEIIE